MSAYYLGQNMSEFDAWHAHQGFICHIADIFPTKGMS